MVLAVSASLKVAVTLAVALTPEPPAAGLVDVTRGGATSGPLVVLNTTSTKYPSEENV